MYIYSHALIGGGLVGTILFQNEPNLQAVCLAGAILPDLISIPFHTSRILRGKDANLLSREISHSVIVASATSFIFLFFFKLNPVFLALISGWISHLFVDALTHSRNDFVKHDASLFWPFCNIKLGQIIGIWDYRHPFTKKINWMIFKPKTTEVLIDLLCIIIWFHCNRL